MLLHTLPAPTAPAAADIDFADDPLPYPALVVCGRAIDDAHELVAGNAVEAGVAFENLQICAAIACQADANPT